MPLTDLGHHCTRLHAQNAQLVYQYSTARHLQGSPSRRQWLWRQRASPKPDRAAPCIA